jgi:hypothetical protein
MVGMTLDAGIPLICKHQRLSYRGKNRKERELLGCIPISAGDQVTRMPGVAGATLQKKAQKSFT